MMALFMMALLLLPYVVMTTCFFVVFDAALLVPLGSYKSRMKDGERN